MKFGKPRGLYLLWRPDSRFGPWPLYRWGTRVGFAFDVGRVRIALRWRKDPA